MNNNVFNEYRQYRLYHTPQSGLKLSTAKRMACFKLELLDDYAKKQAI
jgi:hypothetical protein